VQFDLLDRETTNQPIKVQLQYCLQLLKSFSKNNPRIMDQTDGIISYILLIQQLIFHNHPTQANTK
jgi:hypothetical protein